MPSFRTGVVVEILEARPGLQRVTVDLGAEPERAYVLTQITGPVAVGDRVVVNTTAVQLGLGTGGSHVVHWNLARTEFSDLGAGSIMKVRYTSAQVDVGGAEEEWPELVDADSIDGMPVVAASLHSQLAAIAVAYKHARPDARLAYVMTDGGALPIAISDLVWQLRERQLLDATITCGHAFGGDYEAVSVAGALAIARRVVHADATVVVMGPGGAGTATRLGFSGIEVGAVLDTAAALGGSPIAAVRYSEADPRARHRGISHHTVTTLSTATRSRVVVALPSALEVDTTPFTSHDLVRIPAVGIIELMQAHGLAVASMGRPAADDPWLFECAAAAGTVAAGQVP